VVAIAVGGGAVLGLAGRRQGHALWHDVLLANGRGGRTPDGHVVLVEPLDGAPPGSCACVRSCVGGRGQGGAGEPANAEPLAGAWLGLAPVPSHVQETLGEALPPFSVFHDPIVTVRVEDDPPLNVTFSVDDVTSGKMFAELGRVRRAMRHRVA